MHWTEKYLTIPYEKGKFVCTDLVRIVLDKEAGLQLPIPPSTQWRGLQTETLSDRYDEMVPRIDNPSEYDVVLMKIQGNKRSLGSHLGVFTKVGGKRRVLHALENQGVRLDILEHMQHLGLEIVSYHRCLGLDIPGRTEGNTELPC